MNEQQQIAFERWWDEEGSRAPKHRLDCEEHCYQIAKTAWSNGAYKALEQQPTCEYCKRGLKTMCLCGTEQRPAYRAVKTVHEGKPYYVSEPEQPAAWVGLTDEEMLEALISVDPATKRLPIGFVRFARAIEAKLRKKNT